MYRLSKQKRQIRSTCGHDLWEYFVEEEEDEDEGEVETFYICKRHFPFLLDRSSDLGTDEAATVGYW